MTYRIRTLAIALSLAVLAALLTGFYVTSYKNRVDQRQERVPVVVAASDIPAGTSGAVLQSKRLLKVEQIARSAVVPGAISKPEALAKLVSTQPTYLGEQVTARRFGPVAVEGVRSQLTGAFRAVRIAGDENQVLAGVIRPGDHVDVLANVKFPNESSQKHFARVVLRDVLVLRASGSSGAAKITNPNSARAWVMLRVTDTQAHRLFFVVTNEDWTLALRPGLDDSDSPTGLTDAKSILSQGARGTDARALATAEGETP